LGPAPTGTMASDHAEDFFFLHCNWQTIDSCWSGSSKRQWQSTDTNHPTTQMEVGGRLGNLSSAGRRAYTHAHVSVQASHALFNLSGVAGDTKLSLLLSRGCAFRSQICCRYVLNSSTYSFGRMMVMMTTTCGCFTDNNYQPQAENAFGIRICVFFYWIRDGNIYSVGKSCYGKSTQPRKSTQAPPPLLIYVSYILRLLRLIWQKNFIRKYEGLCEKKLTFSKLATPEVQVPVWLIDAYWNGNKNFQLKKVKFSKSMARPPRGWVERVLIGDIFFWMVFFPLTLGGKKLKKKREKCFFFPM